MRRRLAAALVLIVMGSTAAAAANDFPYGQTLTFAIYRNGQEIGQHRLSFQNDGGNRTVTVAVNFAVKAMGVTAYRYVHRQPRDVERQHPAGAGLENRRQRQEVRRACAARRQAAWSSSARRRRKPFRPPPTTRACSVRRSSREVLPANILPTSNWNFGQVGQSVLLNTQYGTQSHATVTTVGREPVKTATGNTIAATRYHYTGDIRMDQWFDDRGRWVKAAFRLSTDRRSSIFCRSNSCPALRATARSSRPTTPTSAVAPHDLFALSRRGPDEVAQPRAADRRNARKSRHQRFEVPCRPTKPCPQRPFRTTPSPKRRSTSRQRERRPGRVGRSNTATALSSSTAFGDIGASAGEADGLFHNDTRFLSHLELRVNGEQPLLLGSNLRDDNTLLSVDLTNPDIFVDERIVLPKDLLHIVADDLPVARPGIPAPGRAQSRRSRHRPFARASVQSDFADLFEVRGHAPGAPRRAAQSRDRRRTARCSSIAASTASQRHHARLRSGAERARPRRGQLPARAGARRKSRSIFLIVGCDQPADQQPAGVHRAVCSPPGASCATRRATTTTVETSNELFNEILRRSVADLAYADDRDAARAAIPMPAFPGTRPTFGRDGLITALQMLWCDPGIARGVLRRLAAFQATETDPRRRRPARQDPARDARAARWRRCGRCRSASITAASTRRRCSCCSPASMSSAPATIATLRGAVAGHRGGARLDRRAGRSRRRRLSSNIAAPAEQGLANQGWKDSHDAIFHADGRLAEGPIALAEVQGYVYAAKHGVARCARRLGRRSRRASSKREAAAAAPSASRRHSGARELGTYALALDGDKQPCRVRTSNAGQLLFTGIARAGSRRAGRATDARSRASSRAGAFAPWPRARRATIRCPITTARSGRTTTR